MAIKTKIQCIYKITNKINNNCYIGQSINVKQRWLEHTSTAFLPNRVEYKYPLYRAIRKYGLDNFEFEILEIVNSKDNLTTQELYWYNEYKPEYNQMIPLEHTSGSKKPVYKIEKGSLKILKRYDSIRSASVAVENDESHIAAVCRGKEISAAGFHWCFEKDWFDDWKPRSRKKYYNGIKVAQLDRDTKEVLQTYNSIIIASKNTGIDNSNIAKCCKNKCNHAGGYLWEYI